MHRWKLPLALLALVLVFGCGRQAPLAPERDANTIPSVDLSELDRIERATRLPERPLALGGPKLVIVPAGSVDALAAAIAQAGDAGTVILESGVHTESGTVEVNRSTTIAGWPGAVLVSTSDPLANPVQPALWVHGAANVVVRGLEIKPSGPVGNMGILLQNAPNASVLMNNVHDFVYGVIVEQSDHAKVWSNRVACTTAWQTGAVPEAHGIIVVNGQQCLIAKNDVRDALFGIWPCDRGGRAIANRITGCFVGLILCKVPTGALTTPDGLVAGAAQSAANWLVQRNETFGNFTDGILAIDGANASTIVDNDSHDNGTYDVEMSGDSFRFGFLTPSSFDCRFIAGSFPNVRVKDCGNGNSIVGGVVVDTSTDPCY